ncbi:MAG TPA: branched-chain amino acid ABC transporter permease [Dermatophilaceae bacterium]
MTLSGAVQVTLAGLETGALYAFFLIGVLLVYQVSKQINFSYGQMGMVAAFGSWWLYSDIGLPVAVAVIVGIATSIIVAGLTEVLIIRRIPEKRVGYDLVVTLGVLLLLTAGAQVIFGTSSQSYLDLLSSSRVVLSGVFINGNDVLVVVIGVAAVIATRIALDRTGAGLSLRASAENAAVARSVGINVTRLRTTIWVISGLIAAVSGILLGSRLSVDPFYMTPFLINTFIAGMIGGMDRFWPPIIAAFGLGVYDSWAMFVFGPNGDAPAVFVLALVILSAAPRRFVEERYEARA